MTQKERKGSKAEVNCYKEGPKRHSSCGHKAKAALNRRGIDARKSERERKKQVQNIRAQGGIIPSEMLISIPDPEKNPTPDDLHQQKQILRLIRGRCVLTQATYVLRPMRPVRPDLRCNAPPHSTPPKLPRNVPSVLTQPRLLPASRLPQTLVVVTSFSSPRPNTSLIPGITINRLLPQNVDQRLGQQLFFFGHIRVSRLTSQGSGLTPHRSGDLINWVSRNSLLYLLYTVSRCRILTYSRVLILSSGFLNKPR